MCKKKKAVFRCERCRQVVLPNKQGVIYKCPCHKLALSPITGGIDWRDVSVREVLPDGTLKDVLVDDESWRVK